MRRPKLNEINAARALALKDRGLTMDIFRGQWNPETKLAYEMGIVLIELRGVGQPIKAYRKKF